MSPYVLIPEAAAIACTSEKTVRHWLLVGKLKARKPGRRVLIKRDELMAFIEGTAE
jgi:excisionase family DNA binding protein